MVYVRRFSDTKWVRTDKVKFSTYFPEPMNKSLFHEDILDSDYMICPLYKEGDLQIGVTGTVGQRETYSKGMFREMGEEVGLIPENIRDDMEFVANNVIPNKNQRMSVYIAYIDDVEPLNDDDHDFEFTLQGKDNKSKKVGCIVYGEKGKILHHLNRVRINRYYSTDSIVGIGAIKVKNAREYILKITD